MKTIELTNEQYHALLTIKNRITIKVHNLPKTASVDFEPSYTCGACIMDMIDSIMTEHRTGKVNYIT